MLYVTIVLNMPSTAMVAALLIWRGASWQSADVHAFAALVVLSLLIAGFDVSRIILLRRYRFFFLESTLLKLSSLSNLCNGDAKKFPRTVLYDKTSPDNASRLVYKKLT